MFRCKKDGEGGEDIGRIKYKFSRWGDESQDGEDGIQSFKSRKMCVNHCDVKELGWMRRIYGG